MAKNRPGGADCEHCACVRVRASGVICEKYQVYVWRTVVCACVRPRLRPLRMSVGPRPQSFPAGMTECPYERQNSVHNRFGANLEQRVVVLQSIQHPAPQVWIALSFYHSNMWSIVELICKQKQQTKRIEPSILFIDFISGYTIVSSTKVRVLVCGTLNKPHTNKSCSVTGHCALR